MLTVEDIELAGVRSRAIRVSGESGKPTFLFLHGFSDSADGWRRVQRRLGEAGYPSFAVDQPTHGQADLLDPDQPVVEQFVRFAAAAAEQAAGGDRVIVVGNSLGGAHALLLGERHPELLLGVVAISPAAFDHPRWFGVLDEDNRVGRQLRQRAAARVADAGDPASGRATGSSSSNSRPNGAQRALARAVADTGFRAVAFARPWRVPSSFVEDWRKQWRDPDRRRALRDLTGKVRDEYLHVDLVDLRAITVPVLTLWGNRDRLTSISSRTRFEAEIPDLTFVELRGIGHMPQLEVPGLTTKHLVRFADRLSG